MDVTCPTVRRAQKAAKKLADSGFTVVIYGDADHPEVRGLLGWAGATAVATIDAGKAAEKVSGNRLGIIAQTTQSMAGFAEFVGSLLRAAGSRVREVRIINTLCQKTQQRQDAAMELARRSDLMIVVGGKNSANTRRLAQVCSSLVETHLIEKPEELDETWLAGKRHIGVTAGASTPEETVDDVVLKLQAIVDGTGG
jgi:4-hydroxy-3-methylbut-2-enyl diphosphate reductase